MMIIRCRLYIKYNPWTSDGQGSYESARYEVRCAIYARRTDGL